MKRSKIYREAARRIAESPRDDDGEERYSCDQIWLIAQMHALDLREEYAKLFRPDDNMRGRFWLHRALRPFERPAWRVTALLFMAAISEWEESHEEA